MSRATQTAGVGQGAFRALMKSIPSPDKERIRFPDGYHDLIHDKNERHALECIGAWMEREIDTDTRKRSLIEDIPL